MSLPIIGAALPTDRIETYRDWLFEKDRDIEIQSFHTAAKLDGDWQPEAERVKELLDGHTGRRGMHGPFWGFSIATPDPDVQKIVARRMDQALDVCAAIEATQMVIHSPYTTWDYNNLDGNPGARERIIECVHASIGAAVDRATDQGVTLVIENIEDIDPQDRRLLAASFNSEAIRLSIDTGHAHYAHVSTGAPPVDYFVHAAGDWLHHVHLQDADGYADRHWALGEGTIRWASVFRALEQTGATPHLVLELRDPTQVPAAMRHLEEAGLAQ